MADEPGKTVGDYVTLQRGITYSGALVGEPGPALLGLGSIEPGGGFRAGHYKTFGGECPAKIMLVPGDIYVALKGATKDGSMVGSVARLPEAVPSGRLTQDTARLDFFDRDPDIVSHLYWVLRTPQYRQYCAGRLTGSAAASFSREDFLSYPVPPATKTSRATVSLLDTIERRLELNPSLNETLEAVARALFKSWFVDFAPVRAKAEGRAPGLPKALADLFPSSFEDSELGEVPTGWRVSALAACVDVARGLSYKGSGLSQGGTPMHNLNSIHEGGGYKFDGLKHYVGEYKSQHVVRSGDVIVANTEQGHQRLLIGYAAIVPSCSDHEMLFSHHIYLVRPKLSCHLTPDYLCHLLNSTVMHDTVSGYSNGTTVNMLPMDGLQKPAMVVPPPRLVDAFDGIAKAARRRHEVTVEESRTLAALRDTLLPKLVSGDLRVKEVDDSVQEATS